MIRKKPDKKPENPRKKQMEKILALDRAEHRVKVSIDQIERIKESLHKSVIELQDSSYSTQRLKLICNALEKVQKGLTQESKTLNIANPH